VGGETRDRSWSCLKKGGILVALIGPPPAQETAEAYGVRQKLIWLAPNTAQLREIGALVDAGKVRVQVETILPLAEAGAAQELNATGRTRGKIVLKVV
jgi:NADPH:quinone reductase-like Zn-dependent oxidoreductase